MAAGHGNGETDSTDMIGDCSDSFFTVAVIILLTGYFSVAVIVPVNTSVS
jgi:hypothetical protein